MKTSHRSKILTFKKGSLEFNRVHVTINGAGIRIISMILIINLFTPSQITITFFKMESDSVIMIQLKGGGISRKDS